MPLQKIILIVGPTAVGKSDLAYDLAGRVPAQIVSCDSAQVYKELNIVTNKPSIAIQQRIPHHVIDEVSVTDSFNVSQYNDLANAAIRAILKQDQVPIVVGGTGLYVKVLLDGLFESGDPDIEYRENLRKEQEQFGADHLHRRLAEVDAVSAEAIHPNDIKKIIRALEVYHQEGRPMSELKKECRGLCDEYDVRVFGVHCSRDRLYERINARVVEMVEAGALEEIRAVRDLKISSSASGIIGLREMLGHLNGEHDLERAIYLMQLNTRHFAKRQFTWFNAERRLTWLNREDYHSLTLMTDEILRKINL